MGQGDDPLTSKLHFPFCYHTQYCVAWKPPVSAPTVIMNAMWIEVPGTSHSLCLGHPRGQLFPSICGAIEKVFIFLFLEGPILKVVVSSYCQLWCHECALKHVFGTAKGPSASTQRSFCTADRRKCYRRLAEWLFEVGEGMGKVELGRGRSIARTGGSPCQILNPVSGLGSGHKGSQVCISKILVET